MIAASRGRFKGKQGIVETDSIDSACNERLAFDLRGADGYYETREQQLFTRAMPNWRPVAASFEG
jgi:hypothetical protein